MAPDPAAHPDHARLTAGAASVIHRISRARGGSPARSGVIRTISPGGHRSVGFRQAKHPLGQVVERHLL
jgi:hypothetical protein